MTTEISVPDIGDFESVEIIEILVKPGDTINKNDPIVTLESDKSSVEVPSPFAGKISALKVKIGDKVSKGNVLALIDNEKVKVEQDAMTLIVRSADGSVRDGLSLLDQAITNQNDLINSEKVIEMLGLADRGKIFELLNYLMCDSLNY